MFHPQNNMKIYTSNILKLIRNSFIQRSIRIILIYSLIYLTTAEIFADNSSTYQNCKNEYLISVSQNSVELNINERNLRYKSNDYSGLNYDKSALIFDHFFNHYTEYFLNRDLYSVTFLQIYCNTNNSFRAPPKN
jgi:hypothetical protein